MSIELEQSSKIINESKFVKSYFNQDYFLWHTAQEFENKYIAEMMEQNVNDDFSIDDEYDESDIGHSDLNKTHKWKLRYKHSNS
nr:hypothetical protein [Mycoplasmopsis bovis]